MRACRIVLGLAATLGLAASAIGAPAHFPLRVSENGRYLVDQDGQPFLVHGDSQWESVWRLTREEMAEYLDHRAAQGFNVTYSYRETYVQTHEDRGCTAAKPTLMIESGYEREANGDWTLVLEAERRSR